MFTRAAQDLAQKQEIYQKSYLETGRDFYKYPPAFALGLIPLSKLHDHLAVPIWFLLTFIFFISAIFLTQKILSADNRTKILSKTYFALAILLSLRFLLSVVQRVQSDALVLVLLSLFIFALFHKKDIGAGISLAAASMVKLTPLIFLPYLLLRRKFKTLLASLLALVFFLLAPAMHVGWTANLNYLKNFVLVHQNNSSEYILWFKNQSLLSCLLRFLTKQSEVGIFNLDPNVVLIIFIILGLGLFGLVFVLRKNHASGPSGFCYLAEIAQVLILMILLSPLGWKHTFVHLIIVHLVLLYYLFYLNPADKITRGLLICSFVLNTVLNPELTKPFAKLVQLYSSVTLGTLILYAALLRARYKLCRR